MSREALWENIKKYRVLLATAVAAGLILFCLGGYQHVGGWKEFWFGFFSILGNLTSAVIGFIVASLLFSSEDSARFEAKLREIIQESSGNPTTLDQVPWANLIANAEEIDFVVQGWDGWGAQTSIAAALTEFFQRKGIFRLYVCNPNSPGAQHPRSLLEERLGRSPGDVQVEIKNTLIRIKESWEQVPLENRGPAVEVFQTDKLNWYFAAFFKGRKFATGNRARDIIVFSIYAHTNRRPWNMPAQVVYPDTQPKDFRDWFKKELKYLRDGVPKPSA